jgi:hypothetical protein
MSAEFETRLKKIRKKHALKVDIKLIKIKRQFRWPRRDFIIRKKKIIYISFISKINAAVYIYYTTSF